MKCACLQFVILYFSLSTLFGQQSTGLLCEIARPFCSGTNYVFPNATSGTAQDGPNYGCLTTRPNPIWYYLEIDIPGTIRLALSQSTNQNGTGGIDVDFAMWGPFNSVGEGCVKVVTDRVPPIQCSYSSSDTETIGIGFQGGTSGGQSTPAAGQSGQIYLLLLTNYSNRNGYISLTQTAGTGSTNCDIITLPVELYGLSAKRSANHSILEWSMFFQNNVDYMEVQRTTEGTVWTTVGTIPVNEQLINQSYQFKDTPFAKSKVYYRIAIVGFDGVKVYSAPVFINHSDGAKEVKAILNEVGIEVTEEYNGLKIYQYEDGSVERIYGY